MISFVYSPRSRSIINNQFFNGRLGIWGKFFILLCVDSFRRTSASFIFYFLKFFERGDGDGWRLLGLLGSLKDFDSGGGGRLVVDGREGGGMVVEGGVAKWRRSWW